MTVEYIESQLSYYATVDDVYSDHFSQCKPALLILDIVVASR